ncbi:MAG: type IV pilus assembly protein PilM [Deferribacterota bacterium]|nr:type IV pilus assembly protein PilM [Deferribacterota bacterium]
MIKKGKNLVGVDFGSHSVKIAEIKPVKDSYLLKGISLLELPEESLVEGKIIDFTAVVDTLTEAYNKGRFTHKSVVTALKGFGAIAKRIDIEIEDMKTFKESFRWESNQYVDYDPNTMNIDYYISDKKIDQNKIPVIVAVAKKDIINDIKFIFDTAKLHLKTLDLETFALVNLLEYNYPDIEGLVSIIDIGHEKIHISFVENALFRFAFDLDVGVKNCIDLFKQMYDRNYDEVVNILSSGESLKNDDESLSIINQFYERAYQSLSNVLANVERTLSQKVGKFYVCGGGVYLPGFVDFLREKLSSEVEYFNPFNKIDINTKEADIDFVENNMYRFNVAVGLSLRRVDDTK